jgi:hypothetical protein
VAAKRQRLPINAAARDGTLIRFWCRSEVEPVTGYWSRRFLGWVAYHEPIPLVRHDVTGWEPIADQAVAKAVPLEKVRQAGATTVVLGTVKAERSPATPTGRRARKPVVVVGRPS